MLGREVWYEFQPLGCPIVDNRLVIARWKQNGCSPRFDDRNLIGSTGRDWLLNYVEHFLDRTLERTFLGSLFGDPDTVPPIVPLSLRKRERVRVRVRLDCMDNV